VDRPLTEPRHWRRARGRLVRVGVAGGGELRGRVTSADELAVCFDVDGVVRTVPYPELGRGRVQVEFR
jgi:ribosome maturation factor RimP